MLVYLGLIKFQEDDFFDWRKLFFWLWIEFYWISFDLLICF